MSSRRISAFLAACLLVSYVAQAQPTLLSAVLRPPGGGTPGDGFGRSVAAAGNWIVVGAPGDDERGTDAGAVYVFGYSLESARKFGTPPRLVQKLVPAELLPGDRFGWSVAIHDYTPPVMPYPSQVRAVIVVGAPGDDRDPAGVPGGASRDRGAAYVFGYPRWSGTGPPFTQEARLQPVELAAGDEFGWTVGFTPTGSAGPLYPEVAVAAVYRDVPDSNNQVLADAGVAWTYSNRRNPDPPYDYTWTGSGTLGRTRNLFGPAPLSAPVGGARFGFRVGDAISDLADVGFFDGRPLVARDLPAEFYPATIGFCGIATEPDGTILVGDWQINGTITDQVFPRLQYPRCQFAVRRLAADGRVLGSLPFPEFNTPNMPPADDCLAYGPTGTWMATTQIVYRPERATTIGGFSHSSSIDADQAGNAYVIDGYAVRRIGADNTVTTIAGEVAISGTADGVGTAARFHDPSAIAAASSDVIFVGDGTAIRRVDLSTRAVVTVAGAFDDNAQRDGAGTQARFRRIAALDVDSTGTLWIADAGTLRLMSPGGEVTTIAGAFGTSQGRQVDGIGAAARLFPKSIAVAGDRVRFIDERDPEVRRLDELLVREASASGDVRTLLGTGLTPTGLLGYSFAEYRGKTLVGAPLSPLDLSPVEQAGAVWEPVTVSCEGFDDCLELPTYVRAVQPSASAPHTRYATAMASLENGLLALGPANGCLWKRPHECVDDAAGTPSEATVVPVVVMNKVGDAWRDVFTIPAPSLPPHSGYGSVMAANENLLVVGAPQWDYRPQEPGGGDITGPGVVYVYDLAALADEDQDTLPDTWETTFGLSPTSAVGNDGPSGDADGDGLTNAEEFAAQSHPRNGPQFTRYFAEGAASDLFVARFALVNPGEEDATVVVRFEKARGTASSRIVVVPAHKRRTIVANDEIDMAGAEFSTVIESDRLVVADRVMSWRTEYRTSGPVSPPNTEYEYGSHGERALVSPATRWYLAEGATHSGFDLFYLLQNPTNTEAQVRVRYLLSAGAPVEKSYAVAPRSRFTIWVNEEREAIDPETRILAEREMSAEIVSRNEVPLLVERAMYLTRPGSLGSPGGMFEAGHASAGLTQLSTRWFFAEGATGDFFDLYFLLANPSATPARVRATYLLDSGATFTKMYEVPSNARITVWADGEVFDGIAGRPLEAVNVSTTFEVLNDVPIAVERAMWWPGPTAATWTEAHASQGVLAPATRWAIAAGQSERRLPCAPDNWCFATPGQPQPEIATYYLIANPGPTPATVRITLLLERDHPAPLPPVDLVIGAHTRQTVRVWTQQELLYRPDRLAPAPGAPFPPPGTVTVGADRDSYGALFESIGTAPAPIVVEWAIYNDALGIFWAAGANALATPLP